jgi:hypothetical protein
VVAGVPPDAFSATGQLWGNPLYNWDVHKKEGYKWWLSRVRASLGFMDILRFDHFRGFAGYYEIPAGEATAETGAGCLVPRMTFSMPCRHTSKMAWSRRVRVCPSSPKTWASSPRCDRIVRGLRSARYEGFAVCVFRSG